MWLEKNYDGGELKEFAKRSSSLLEPRQGEISERIAEKFLVGCFWYVPVAKRKVNEGTREECREEEGVGGGAVGEVKEKSKSVPVSKFIFCIDIEWTSI